MIFSFFSYSEFVSGRFDTSGSMIPRLVPEILPLDAFCDLVVAGVGIGDSRNWTRCTYILDLRDGRGCGGGRSRNGTNSPAS